MITFSQLGRQGRLGNQLWQIAVTIATAKRNNQQYRFPRWEYEPHFNLHGCFDMVPILPTYQEQQFHYVPLPQMTNQDLSGYFQSQLYSGEYWNDIREMLTPVHNFDLEPGLCSIHIRRGDYLTKQQYHPVLSMDYYKKAIERVGAKRYLVFSDDPAWAKCAFSGDGFEFIEANNPAIDLAMMSKRCQHNIIANSSFSHWGAGLNRCSDKIVIAPIEWFGPALSQHNTKDLLPPEWIRL